MEKRIGTISIVIYDKSVVATVNEIISQYADTILSRQGLPLHERGLNIINLVIDSSADQINALTGRLGRLNGLEVKAILAKLPPMVQ